MLKKGYLAATAVYACTAHTPEIIKEYSPNLHNEVVPALRFQGAWKERKRFPDQSKFTVMIPLDGEKMYITGWFTVGRDILSDTESK